MNKKRSASNRRRKTAPPPKPAETQGPTFETSRHPGTGPQRIEGTSLGLKFALVISCLIVVLMGVSGYVVSSRIENTMFNQIKKRGAMLAEELGVLGKVMLLANEELGYTDNTIPVATTAKLKDALSKLEKVNQNALERMLFFTGEAGATKNELRDAVLTVQRGFVEEMFVSANDKPLVWTGPEPEPVQVKQGDKSVELDVDMSADTMEIDGNVEQVYRFTKVILRDPKQGRGVPNMANVMGNAHVVLSLAEVDRERKTLLWFIAGVSIVGILVGVLTASLLASIVVRPVKALVKDMEVVSDGDLDHETRPHSRDEIGLLATTFDRMTRSLRAGREAELEKERMARDLDIATEIQSKLLPKQIPRLKGFDTEAFYRAAKEVGGDYYDFIYVDRQHLGIVVADVSGKGVPGSLVMTSTRSVLRLAAPGIPTSTTPLVKVNSIIHRDVPRGMFVTALYGVLDVRTFEMSVASAGHNPMLVLRASGEYELVNPSGIALGFDSGQIFNSVITEEKVKIGRGDRVVIYTDGVVEAMNPENEEFGSERFYELAKSLKDEPSADFVQKVVAALDDHKGTGPQHDDITLVTFRLG